MANKIARRPSSAKLTLGGLAEFKATVIPLYSHQKQSGPLNNCEGLTNMALKCHICEALTSKRAN